MGLIKTERIEMFLQSPSMGARAAKAVAVFRLIKSELETEVPRAEIDTVAAQLTIAALSSGD